MQTLREQGYHVIAALDEEDALERVGRHVREHAKYDRQTPLVVMPEKYGKEVEGTDVNVEGNDWIMYLGEEPDRLRNLLGRLISGAASLLSDS